MAAIAFEEGLRHVGLALRKPDELVLRWKQQSAEAPVPPATFAFLAVTSILCLAAYGLTMGMPHGLPSMLRHALLVPGVALIAWGLSLPSLYVLNTALGSPLDRSTTILAALTAMHFGSLARLASAPVSWFFSVTLPYPWLLTVIHLAVLGVTALCMADVFMRVMKRIDPKANPLLLLGWLALVAGIDVELKMLLAVFAL
jgi:hypothetical protein